MKTDRFIGIVTTIQQKGTVTAPPEMVKKIKSTIKKMKKRYKT